jgi:hypothetical protein
VIGHAGYGVHFQQPRLILAGPPSHPPGPSRSRPPRRTPDGPVPAIPLPAFLRQPARTEIAGVAGVILGLVVVEFTRRFQPDQRQRFALQHRAGVFLALNPRLHQHRRIAGSGPLPGDLKLRWSLTRLMPMLEPSQDGFTASGRPNSDAASASSAALATMRHGGVGKPTPCQSCLVRSLSMPSAEASTPLPV